MPFSDVDDDAWVTLDTGAETLRGRLSLDVNGASVLSKEERGDCSFEFDDRGDESDLKLLAVLLKVDFWRTEFGLSFSSVLPAL